MNAKRKPNAMLIELIIVILFFSISAGIILQLFVASHERSLESSIGTSALFMAEAYAEQFAASTLPVDAFLEDAGFVENGGAYTRQAEINGRTVTISALSETTASEAGTLDRLDITVSAGERPSVSLPATRYLPKEDTP